MSRLLATGIGLVDEPPSGMPVTIDVAEPDDLGVESTVLRDSADQSRS